MTTQIQFGFRLLKSSDILHFLKSKLSSFGMMLSQVTAQTLAEVFILWKKILSFSLILQTLSITVHNVETHHCTAVV